MRKCRRFAASGIPTKSPLAQKLWTASRILGDHIAGGPFGKPLIDYTHLELDFVLEMAALDEPDKYTFLRNGKPTNVGGSSATLTQWADVLDGTLAKLRRDRMGLSRAIAGAAAYRARKAAGSGGGFKLGLTRGGKPLDAGNTDRGSGKAGSDRNQ